MRKRWCYDHETSTSDNWKRAWYGQMRRSSCCSLRLEEFVFGEQPKKRTVRNAWFQQWNTGKFCAGLDCNIVVFSWSHYYYSWPITWTRWVIRCITWSRRYLWKTMQRSKTTVPPRTAGTVYTWFEGHEVELPWPEHSPDFNIIEQTSVLGTRARNRFPRATSPEEF
jgi:hypothetical protein